MSERKLILYISMSLDGFIATKDDDISWLSIVEHTGENYGYTKFTETVDTYIIGRKTYEVVLKLTNGKFPQAERFKCYVLSRQKRKDENGITFYNGKVEDLIQKIKKEKGKNIYCDGGGQIVKLLMEKNLIDEYIISIMPIVLGDGKRLFLGGTERFTLQAKAAEVYKSGLIQLRYTREEMSGLVDDLTQPE